MENSEIITKIEREGLLLDIGKRPSFDTLKEFNLARKNLLHEFGYRSILQDGEDVGLENASPEAVKDQVRALYYVALREEGKL